MGTMTAELQELVDRQKIYHVLTSYCRALDRCDVELMKSVYWEDGYDDHGVFESQQGQDLDWAWPPSHPTEERRLF